MKRNKLLITLQRYAMPCLVRSLYFSVRYRCLVSFRADIQLSPYIKFGRGTDVRPFARIVTKTGKIEFGINCGIGSFVYIGAGKAAIKIGDYVRIGAHTYIGATNRGYKDPNRLIVEQERTEKGIEIGRDVWIGANAVVLDGVEIGDGSVIGAGSIVTRHIPNYSVAVGNPARVIKVRGE